MVVIAILPLTMLVDYAVGTKDALADIKVTVPTYENENLPGYTYTVDSSWTLVSDKGSVNEGVWIQ